MSRDGRITNGCRKVAVTAFRFSRLLGVLAIVPICCFAVAVCSAINLAGPRPAKPFYLPVGALIQIGLGVGLFQDDHMFY